MDLAEEHRDSIRKEIDDLLARRLPDADRREIAEVMSGTAIALVLRERQRCVEVCRGRAELWLRTSERGGSPPLREEGRSRANEARYLADLLEMEEAFGFPDA